ncbi:Mov34/MPN/PAD-1 family protein [Brevundimonas sp.]|uniref:Mov34/MPN/PAD-1 family protein n=1 Tax=Brevundimonas sp. TaxID=1871086 RepID=UPI003FA606D1
MSWGSGVLSLWIAKHVIAAIQRESEQIYPLETGGMLLGWRDGNSKIVTGFIGPGPSALHGRYMFLPDHRWQVEHLRHAFLASGGDLDYLGDWHTHPDGVAKMSDQDSQTLRKICRRVPHATMLIRAGHPSSWSMNAWIGERQRPFRPFVPQACRIQEFEAPEDWPRYQG